MDFFGGQDIYDIFLPASLLVNGGNRTEYDSVIDEIRLEKIHQYVFGECTREEAIAAFKQEVKEQLGFDAW